MGKGPHLPVVWLLVAAVLAALAPAVESPGATRADALAGATGVPRLGYVGRVEGTRAYVGIVVRKTTVTAYVCDGRGLSRWFSGEVRTGRATLREPSGGVLELRLSGVVRGVLRLPGRRSRSFSAVAAHGRAGLYRAERVARRSGRLVRLLTGWVRLNDGSLRGATLTSRFRTVRPAPGVEAVLVSTSAGQVGPASGAPTREQRETVELVPVCELIKGATSEGRVVSLMPRGCGLPLAGAAPPAAPGPRVLLRPADFALSADVLARFAADLKTLTARQQGELLKRAGQRDPRRRSAETRARIDKQAAGALKDRGLLDAAQRFRTAPAAARANSLAAYQRALKPYTDPLSDILALRSPLAAVYTLPGPPVRLPVRRTYRGPWAEVVNIESEGDDWETSDDSFHICRGLAACTPLLNIAADATKVRAHSRAGFNSKVTFDKAHVLAFDVPADAGAVEVEIKGSRDLDVDTENCFGIANGFASAGYYIVKARADGSVDALNDPVVTGSQMDVLFDFVSDADDTGLSQDDCLQGNLLIHPGPPVPDPPRLIVVGDGDDVLTFTAPAEGGSYILVAHAYSQASVILGGTAIAQSQLGVDSVTVRYG